VAVKTGELGFVAEWQMVASRHDLTAPEVQAQMKAGPDALPGFLPELYAPLVFDRETLGMIALSRPRRRVGDGKAALRLIAQTGAQALHAAADFSRISSTAEMDALTHVFNKGHMEKLLADLIYRAACTTYDQHGTGSSSGPAGLAIFLFDIDNFKNYNDTHGHLPGDKLLQELAQLAQGNIRKDDIFGRFGGEEFLVILPQTNLTQGMAAANKLRAAIAAWKFPFSETQPMGFLSVSGGVAEYPEDGKDLTSLLRAADAALYTAKRQGRNRVTAAVRSASGERPGPSTSDPVPAPASETRV
jgi:diguanylate cyclase (GGDEF)-like protein